MRTLPSSFSRLPFRRVLYVVLVGSKQLSSADKHKTIKGTIIIVANRKKNSDTLYDIRDNLN